MHAGSEKYNQPSIFQFGNLKSIKISNEDIFNPILVLL